MNVSPLGILAKRTGQVITRDGIGNVTGIFCRIPKMKSSDLDPALPNRTHPAFIIGGVEQESILLGKYLCGESAGKYASLPNLLPHGIDYTDYGDFSTAMGKVKTSAGVTSMTIADWGLLKLLYQKNGWTASGDTCFDASYTEHGNSRWWKGTSYSTGAIVTYAGYRYQCLASATSTDANRPDKSVRYWKKLGYVGGVMNPSGYTIPYPQAGYGHVGGTGPIDWFMGKNPESLCDVIGNLSQTVTGCRVVNGEIQIIPDNDAADPECDCTMTSTRWRAILPGDSETSYTLVAPGTTGTLKYNYPSSTLKLDTVKSGSTTTAYRTFSQLTANTTVPHVPAIVRELGLFPSSASDTSTGQMLFYNLSGTSVPACGSNYGSVGTCGNADIEFMSIGDTYYSNYADYGFRARLLEVSE